MSKESTKYPPKNGGTLVVCEDIRTEVTGKLIMVGVYPGETINFFREPTPDEPGRVNLALSFWFRGARGVFDTKLRIVCPNGDVLIERDLDPSQVAEEGKILSFVVVAKNAEFPYHGKYTVVIALGEREYEFPLFITFTPGSPSTI